MITRNSPQVDFVISMTICPISLNSVTKNENLDMLAEGVWSVVAPRVLCVWTVRELRVVNLNHFCLWIAVDIALFPQLAELFLL